MVMSFLLCALFLLLALLLVCSSIFVYLIHMIRLIQPAAPFNVTLLHKVTKMKSH